MKYLIVVAHPSRESLTSSLTYGAAKALENAGHEVQISDLYAMGWKSAADGDDFPERDNTQRLFYTQASRAAYDSGTQSPDVAAEQEKIRWADVLVLHFPLWWFSMPAIMKGWVDRVWAAGFAYNLGEYGGGQWGQRYGVGGGLEGKRAIVCAMVGGRMPHYGPNGVNGTMDEILWPIQHGILFYTGFAVVPPVVFYQVGRLVTEDVSRMMTDTFVDRLLHAGTTAPIPFRSQNGGDYDGRQVLLPHLSEGVTGQLQHQAEPRYVSNLWSAEKGEECNIHIAPASR